MAIKDLAELIKKFTQKDKFKPTTVQVIRAAKNPPVPAQNEDISVPSEGERIHFLNTGRSDCILLQSGDRFALVDCGDAELVRSRGLGDVYKRQERNCRREDKS